ncbi:hypothetical protein CGRA01v4_03433 [Colletotrichum graminicola]|nr:hypothetical protein CGRA01v4_03433 [Colletotrichum graminicola]
MTTHVLPKNLTILVLYLSLCRPCRGIENGIAQSCCAGAPNQATSQPLEEAWDPSTPVKGTATKASRVKLWHRASRPASHNPGLEMANLWCKSRDSKSRTAGASSSSTRLEQPAITGLPR